MGSYAKAKVRSASKPGFFGLPHVLMQHPNFTRLSGNATKLLMLLGMQYRGGNNGDLAATWSQASAFGFKSSSTLAEAKRELLHYRLISKTRYGGKNRASLYALTWRKIDECKGKLDVAETRVASDEWKVAVDDYVTKHRRNPKTKLNPKLAMQTNVFAMRTNG